MRRALMAGLVLLSACGSSNGHARQAAPPPESITYGRGLDTRVTTTTTQAPRRTTTTAAARPTTSTAPVPAPARRDPSVASLTIVNAYDGGVIVMVNGFEQPMAAHATAGPFAVVPDKDDADWFRVTNDVETCGGADSDDYFEAGKDYELRIEPKAGAAGDVCDGSGLPRFSVILNPGDRHLL